jgi:transcriptional regulator with XRE-family HTH domain
MKLKEWMDKNHISNQDLANKTGHHRTTISKYRTGARTPSIADAIKISEATMGSVTVESFASKKNKKK